MTANVTQIPGANQIQYYFRNYAWSSMSGSLPNLAWGWATDLAKPVVRGASGADPVKVLLDGSGASNLPESTVPHANASGEMVQGDISDDGTNVQINSAGDATNKFSVGAPVGLYKMRLQHRATSIFNAPLVLGESVAQASGLISDGFGGRWLYTAIAGDNAEAFAGGFKWEWTNALSEYSKVTIEANRGSGLVDLASFGRDYITMDPEGNNTPFVIGANSSLYRFDLQKTTTTTDDYVQMGRMYIDSDGVADGGLGGYLSLMADNTGGVDRPCGSLRWQWDAHSNEYGAVSLFVGQGSGSEAEGLRVAYKGFAEYQVDIGFSAENIFRDSGGSLKINAGNRVELQPSSRIYLNPGNGEMYVNWGNSQDTDIRYYASDNSYGLFSFRGGSEYNFLVNRDWSQAYGTNFHFLPSGGTKTTDGAWRFSVSGNDLETQKRVSGAWETKLGTHASMYQTDAATTVTITTADTDVQVGGFTAGESKNCTFDGVSSDNYAVGTAGRYRISYSCSFTSANSNVEAECGISVNGTRNDRIRSSRKIGTGADVGSTFAEGIINLAKDDEVGLVMRNVTNTGNFTIEDSQVTLTYICDD